MYWVNEGAEYCELFIDNLTQIQSTCGYVGGDVLLKDIPHGRVRTCKSAFQLL